MAPATLSSLFWEPQAQSRGLSRFSSTTPASRLVSSPFILKALGFDHHLHGQLFRATEILSCDLGSKENRWSGPIPCFLGTTQTRTLRGLHALLVGATLAAAAPPSEISSFRPLPVFDSSPPPYHPIYTLQGDMASYPKKKGACGFAGVDTPSFSDFRCPQVILLVPESPSPAERAEASPQEHRAPLLWI